MPSPPEKLGRKSVSFQMGPGALLETPALDRDSGDRSLGIMPSWSEYDVNTYRKRYETP